MNITQFFIFLTFIIFNINSVIADTASSKKLQQKHTEICGERTCEFIFNKK
jgi:hypothetical protein